MNPKIIKANDIPDLWFQAVYDILEDGTKYKIDNGSFKGEERIEYDFFIGTIKDPHHPNQMPIMPEGLGIPPVVSEEYINAYVPYLLDKDIKPNEEYTYGNRLRASHFEMKDIGAVQDGYHLYDDTLDQVDFAVNKYAKSGFNTNQVILQIALPGDIKLLNPPCLRHIDTKIKDGKLIFYPYFRSWDLWSGLPSNLIAIAALQQYMAIEIGVEPGMMVCSSKGLHIYGFAEEIVKLRTYKNL